MDKKTLNHVSREKNSPNHVSRKKYRGPSNISKSISLVKIYVVLPCSVAIKGLKLTSCLAVRHLHCISTKCLIPMPASIVSSFRIIIVQGFRQRRQLCRLPFFMSLGTVSNEQVKNASQRSLFYPQWNNLNPLLTTTLGLNIFLSIIKCSV